MVLHSGMIEEISTNWGPKVGVPIITMLYDISNSATLFCWLGEKGSLASKYDDISKQKIFSYPKIYHPYFKQSYERNISPFSSGINN